MIFLIIIAVLAAFLAVTGTVHVKKLEKEAPLREPEGTFVDIEGKKINVYTEGDGEETIVFMAGHGTASPVLDFRSLYSRLSDEYRIAVIEKSGYGYSDVSGRSRDIDTLLADDRAALEKAGINSPYILCPHSYSGMEAIYWAQKYPDEVKAITALDIAYPGVYDTLTTTPFQMKFIPKCLEILVKLGFTRLFPSIAEREAIVHGSLNADERDRYRAMFHYRTATADMSAESASAFDNAEKVKNGGIPDVPLLMFISNGSDMAAESTQAYRRGPEEYASSYKNGKYIELECGHYVHNYEYKQISSEIKAFLSEIKKAENIADAK